MSQQSLESWVPYTDYDVQMTIDSSKSVKWQIVGIREDGRKDILKETTDIPQNPLSMDATKDEIRTYNAPDEKPPSENKKGGIGDTASMFLLGAAIGAVATYLVMNKKIDEHKHEVLRLRSQIHALEQRVAPSAVDSSGLVPNRGGLMREFETMNLYLNRPPKL